MNVAVEDLHTVIGAAKALGGKVVLAGHSLGGSVVTAYATWDFAGSPGADGLSGLVYDDGGSGPTPVSKEQAEESLTKLQEKAPWLAFGGIPAPQLGLFSTLGAMGVITGPSEASLAEAFPLLPSNLKPKNEKGELLPVTNEAEFGYGVNVGSSPPNLAAAQVHAGTGLSEAPDGEGLYTWNGEGATLAAAPLRGNAGRHRLRTTRTATSGTSPNGSRSTPAPSPTATRTRRRKCWASTPSTATNCPRR